MSHEKTSISEDLESGGRDEHLYNNSVHSISWSGISVSLPDRATNGRKYLIQGLNGHVGAGELVAIMGPSGSGKSTLLHTLAHRTLPKKTTKDGEIRISGTPTSISAIQNLACYVEQEDHLIGSLTARETLDFAARLSLPADVSAVERMHRVDALLSAFGLRHQASTIIGTPVRKGLSGGQKRRVGIASQLITCPKVLFLDEPTSGLDSAASFEVIKYLKDVVKKNNIIVIASIHQPSTSTYGLFDTLILLSKGKTCYAGPRSEAVDYFSALGHPSPSLMNPAEFFLEIVNVDFASDRDGAEKTLRDIHAAWADREAAMPQVASGESLRGPNVLELRKRNQFTIPLILLHRNIIKSYRDVFAYGIRIAMYLGLAIMMGTVWLRLGTSQEEIQPFINSIFFGAAFISFMAVAYVPAYLEDLSTFKKERANGLYGPTSFMIANFLIGLPYLFLISFLFSTVSYWLCNFRPSGSAFFTWIMWLFLDLVAAESLVVLMSSLFPIFVVALALTAFANGLWMCVGGFLVSPKLLNVFWRYWARYIDYQAYVFQGMMVNEFSGRTYSCASTPNGCQCMYQSDLAPQCMIRGQAVLDAYGYAPGKTGKWVGILLAIVAGYRILGWITLTLKRS